MSKDHETAHARRTAHGEHCKPVHHTTTPCPGSVPAQCLLATRRDNHATKVSLS